MTAKPGDKDGDRRVIGSLREALAAADRSGSEKHVAVSPPPLPSPPRSVQAASDATETERPQVPSAAEAVLEARGGAAPDDDAPQTRVVRASGNRTGSSSTLARTQLVRGKGPAKKAEFYQDPVVGWLVVVGGAGLGAFRPVFEGNNTIGRNANQRVPIDFGDETISSEEQAYLRYDSVDRRFLLVPNLAKTNIVAVNDQKPTGAVELQAMDVITMGRTQLVFVPFCGPEFDWAALTEMQG